MEDPVQRTASPHALWQDSLAWERAVDDLLHGSHLLAPHELPGLVGRAAARLGALEAVVYLVDLQQTSLVPFFGSADPGERGMHVLPVEGSLAGLAFQRVQVFSQPHEHDTRRYWLPLLNGTERLGVMALVLHDPSGDSRRTGDTGTSVRAVGGQDAADPVDGERHPRLSRFAALVAELVMTKTMYGDTIVVSRRTAPMGLAAEMQWGLLPPLTFASSEVVVAAALEPAYEVAGDSVDYAVDEGRVRFAVFDGMGHGMQSAQLAVLAVTAYRHARRAGRSLTATALAVDNAVHEAYLGEAFVTAFFAELDTDTGQLSYLSAGHPEPLLVRGGRIVKHLHVDPGLPLGLRAVLDPTATFPGGRAVPPGDPSASSAGSPAAVGFTVVTEQLQAGDQVVAFTDGVTEAPSPSGDRFGEQRLVDLLTRHLSGGLPPPETMRRVVRALLDHQQGQLSDDATLLLLAWRSAPEETLLPDGPP